MNTNSFAICALFLLTIIPIHGFFRGDQKRSQRWLSLKAQNQNMTEDVERYAFFINSKVEGNGTHFKGVFRDRDESDKSWYGNKKRFYKAIQISELATKVLDDLYDNTMKGHVAIWAHVCFEYTRLYLDGEKTADELEVKFHIMQRGLLQYKDEDWDKYMKELQEYYQKPWNKEGLLKVIRTSIGNAIRMGLGYIVVNVIWGFIGLLGITGIVAEQIKHLLS